MPEILPLKFSDEQKRVWKANFAPNATPDQWALFVDECERRALIPNTHVVFSLHNASEYDTTVNQWVKVKKVAFITTINALRLLVDRYSDAHPGRAFKGFSKFTYHYGLPDTDEFSEKFVPLSGKIPHAVSVSVRRLDWQEALFVVARYDACVQMKGDKVTPTAMWERRGPEQLLKCCEAAALRSVAPEELGGLYLREELDATLDSTDNPENGKPAPLLVVPVPQALSVPAVNQAPATESVTSYKALGVEHETPGNKPPNAVQEILSAGGLYAGTQPPPPEHSTTVFPPAPVGVPLSIAMTYQPGGPVPETGPVKAAIPPAPAITDDDLPKGLFGNPEPVAPAQPATLGTPAVPPIAVVPAPAAPAETTKPVPQPVVPPPPPAQPAAATPAPVLPTSSKAATQAERNTLNGRFARLTRDHIPKGGIPEKQVGAMLKTYFERSAGVPWLQIPFAKLTDLLVVLENATPEAAAALVKGA